MKNGNDIRVAYSVSEMARALGICSASAYKLVKRDDFPSMRLGNRIVVPVAALNEWLTAQAEKPI